MAYTVNDIKNLVEFVANKQQRGRITPDQFNVAIKAVNLQLMNERLGLIEEYQPGRPVPRIVYDQTIRGKMSMYPFQEKKKMYPSTSGIVSFPTDIIYPTGAFYMVISQPTTTGGKPGKRVVPIDIIDEGRVGYRRGSAIAGPSREYPILVIENGKFQLYPENLGSFTLTYLKRPADPVWASTVVNDRYVYSQNNSVQFQWPDMDFTAIAMRVLKYFGINLRDADVVQTANQMIQAGR